MKKWRCTLCGSIHEAWNTPFECVSCRAADDRLEAVKDDEGEAAKELNANQEGETETVGMYFAFSRQANEEGFPGVAQAFEKIAVEEAKHAVNVYKPKNRKK